MGSDWTLDPDRPSTMESFNIHYLIDPPYALNNGHTFPIPTCSPCNVIATPNIEAEGNYHLPCGEVTLGAQGQCQYLGIAPKGEKKSREIEQPLKDHV